MKDSNNITTTRRTHRTAKPRSGKKKQRERVQAVVSASSNADVEFQSVLRMRPLLKKEKEDHVVLEAAKKSSSTTSSVAVLHPILHLMSPDGSGKPRKSFDVVASPSLSIQQEQEYRNFDKIFDSSATQDTLHYAIGLNMASNAMEPLKKGHNISQVVKNHLAISMGISGGGKSYTVFGNKSSLSRGKQHADDGLVPRILESLFSQSKHHVSSKSSFAIRMTLLHVVGDGVHDLLAEQGDTCNTTPSKKAGVKAMVANFERGGGGGRSSATAEDSNVTIQQNPDTHDYQANAFVKTCWNATEARETLHSGLSRAQTSRFAGFGKAQTRGHTLITLQPVLIKGRRRDSTAVDRCGGTICFLDMAGMERTKKGKGSATKKHDSVAINSSNNAVMHCLRTLKHNSDVRSGRVFQDDDGSSDGSDISNVSEPKEKQQRGIKAVPYRQSKVTMLLQPLFSQTGEWNSFVTLGKTIVTTIVAAYPGHRDYVEKQSLLNDMELLFGIGNTKRPTHRVYTGVKEPSGDTVAESDEDSIVEQKRRNKRGPSPSRLTPSAAPSDKYDPSCAPIDVSLAPIPPPYNPASHTPMASAPSADQFDADPTPSPTLQYSTSSASKSGPLAHGSLEDFPGVSLHVKASPANATPLSGKRAATDATPSSSKRTATTEKLRRAPKSRDTDQDRIALLDHHSKHTSQPAPSPSPRPLMAKVGSSPNIQPPSANRKTTPVKDKSPNRNFMSGSPLKSISRAVQSSKKKGKRALEKIDSMVDRNVYNRLAEDGDASKDSLVRQVKDLEAQNEFLFARNEALEERCGLLEREKEQLQQSLDDAHRRWRQANWTEQDEQEWQRSKRIRVDEERLIGSPLKHHIEHVESTHEQSSQWMSGGKPPFSLQYPRNWTPARVLNERDRSEADTTPVNPPATN